MKERSLWVNEFIPSTGSRQRVNSAAKTSFKYALSAWKFASLKVQFYQVFTTFKAKFEKNLWVQKVNFFAKISTPKKPVFSRNSRFSTFFRDFLNLINCKINFLFMCKKHFKIPLDQALPLSNAWALKRQTRMIA